MPPPPKRKQDLVIQVALDEGKDTLPNVTWRRSPGSYYSSGHSKGNGTGIVVTAGRCRTDQKMLLLHEMAHWLLPPEEAHGSLFWDKAWELYRRYGIPMRHAYRRETGYKKEAAAAYWRMGASQ